MTVGEYRMWRACNCACGCECGSGCDRKGNASLTGNETVDVTGDWVANETANVLRMSLTNVTATVTVTPNTIMCA
jgi:hypothetical protein